MTADKDVSAQGAPAEVEVSPTRPGSARALSVLLLLEFATSAILTVLAIGFAVVIAFVKAKDGWQDLAVTVTLMLGAVAAFCAVLYGTAWVLVRRRRRLAVPASLAAHVLPATAFIAFGMKTDGAKITMAVMLAVAALGIVLTYLAPTRRWLGHSAIAPN